MARCPSCGAFPGSNHHDLCQLFNKPAKRRREQARIEYSTNTLRAHIHECHEILDRAEKLLDRAEKMLLDRADWPSTHAEDFIDWQKRYRRARCQYQAWEDTARAIEHDQIARPTNTD